MTSKGGQRRARQKYRSAKKVRDGMSVGKLCYSAKDYEDTIKKIKDVLAARVVLLDNGEIDEIHVLAGPGRLPKHIVRDVESAIMAAFGVQIDRRKISIAQVNADESPEDRRRIRLTKVAIVAGADLAEVEVHLSLGDAKVVGTASGVPTPTGWLRLAADATVMALSQLLSPRYALSVNHVAVTDSKRVKIAIVSVSLVGESSEQILSGSCPVSYDEREAVVKATLDAVNRRFSFLLNHS